MANKHAANFPLLGAQGYSNANLPGALGHGIRNYTVDSHQTQDQGHTRRNAKHDQSEGRPCHGLVKDLSEETDVGQRKVRADRPNGLLDFLEKGGVACPRAADGVGHVPLRNEFVSPKMLHEHRPVNRGRRFYIYAIIVHIRGDSNDFPPRVLRALPDAPADGLRGFLPIFPCQVLRDHTYRRFVVDVGPGDVAAEQDGISHGCEIILRYPLEAAYGWNLTLRRREVFDKDGVVVIPAVHGD